MKTKVRITQFTNDSNQGENIEIGVADLDVHDITLGPRLVQHGAATNQVLDAKATVRCVKIARRFYALDGPSCSAKSDYIVRLPFDATVDWKSVMIQMIEEEE